MKITGQTATKTEVALAAAVEKLAGWRCAVRPDVIPPSISYLGYDSDSDALLVAAGTKLHTEALNEILKAAHCDALVITCASTRVEEARAHVVLWSKEGIHWYGPLRFWAGEADDLWLIADPVLRTALAMVRLGSCRLKIVAGATAGSAQKGFERAGELLAANLGARP